MVRHTDADDESFAPEYRESRDAIDRDDLVYDRFNGLTVTSDARSIPGRRVALEFEYATSHGNTKTVRSLQATTTSSRDADRGLPNDRESYKFYDDGQGFVVTDNMALYRYGDDHKYRKIADDVDPYMVTLPDPAPVTGAVQEGVSVTVHYRSKRSGNMKKIRLDDVRVEWEGDRVTGYHARRDRTVEVEAVYERSVVTKGKHTTEIGKAARIDFPAGHSYTVEAHGVTDFHSDEVRKAIESAVDAKIGGDDVDVEVSHDGRIDD